MIRVGIIGATGYAGAELVRILSGHPGVQLSLLTSRQYAGIAYEDIYPSMAGVVNIICDSNTPELICDKADVLFMALPHKIPMSFAPGFIEQGKKVIDLSADFRFRNAAAYEAAYQPHTAKALLDEAVYGLSEIYHQEIKTARLIGNPGCYPTSILLPLSPLVKEGLIDVNTIIADAKSGVSGAGREATLTTHTCEVNESFKAYKVAVHRHNPEIDEVLSGIAGTPVAVTFVPHLVPMIRGMFSTIYTNVAAGSGPKQIRDCLNDYYAWQPFVRLVPDSRLPDTRNVRGTNFCDIGFRIDARSNRLILMSAIDNLVKGAAGQAVQNMNIMEGFDQTVGLFQTPYPV
ncbi:MAG: N-acetyl-gamma-glutamyl-phosphate reductase [Desulfobacterales bacterium]|jgi:N-acetyl-gamma-glutamyl-phosphate reductase|nr:N-acetyl-gamma-glutamyl-phosphate reductase [Desulfobacterales bacterium]